MRAAPLEPREQGLKTYDDQQNVALHRRGGQEVSNKDHDCYGDAAASPSSASWSAIAQERMVIIDGAGGLTRVPASSASANRKLRLVAVVVDGGGGVVSSSRIAAQLRLT